MEDRKIKIENGHLIAFNCEWHDQGALVLVSSSTETSMQKVEASGQIPRWMPATCCHGRGCDTSDTIFGKQCIDNLESDESRQFQILQSYTYIQGLTVGKGLPHKITVNIIELKLIIITPTPVTTTTHIHIRTSFGQQSSTKPPIRMWVKWELITAVKHFHQRRR
jgi:hypothetical protein